MKTEAEKIDEMIVKVKDYDNEKGMYQKELLEKETPSLARRGLRLLTCNESRILLADKKFYDKYYSFLPLWTGTYVDYNGTSCKITELGKTWKTKIPESDGWYKLDAHGLPFGEPSNREDQNAGHLWRISKYNGLLSRDYYYFGDGRRYVYACDGGDDRLGVLAVRDKKIKHKHVWECACGAKRKV